MQLVAYGAQDVYLTGNPQITFFKTVYRRHTNFSMESIEHVFNSSVDINKKVSTSISRNGDLIHKLYIEMNVKETFGSNDVHGLFIDNIGMPIFPASLTSFF